MQVLIDILTKLFGYKYHLVVYQIETESNWIKGNMTLKTKRLIDYDIDFVKETLFENQGWDKDKIIILNIIRMPGGTV